MRTHDAIRSEIACMKEALVVLTAACASRKRPSLTAWTCRGLVEVSKQISPCPRSAARRILGVLVYNHSAMCACFHVERHATTAAIDALVACDCTTPRATAAELLDLWCKYEALLLPHLSRKEQVFAPLMRGTQKQHHQLVRKFVHRAHPTQLGSIAHHMGGKVGSLALMRRCGIPSVAWPLSFRRHRATYRRTIALHVDALRSHPRLRPSAAGSEPRSSGHGAVSRAERVG